MRMGRTQYIGARLPDEFHIVDITPGASHQIRVFLPRHRLPNSEIAHRAFTSQPRHEDAGVAFAGRYRGIAIAGQGAVTRHHPDNDA